MKIVIGYPPFDSEKGIPLLSQNRQFQWFKSPTYIYPVIPAYAATLLKNHQFDVVWLDGIASGITYNEWWEVIKDIKPNIIIIESKTPVVQLHWSMINQWKSEMPEMISVLVGDHVTALPEESLENSSVDFILTGGDYDLFLIDFCLHIRDINNPLPPGVFYREENKIVSTGSFRLEKSLDRLPFIDRELTQWENYNKKNGNFANFPGTYIMAARDCWHAKCKFCSWIQLYPEYRKRTPENVVNEIRDLVNNFGVKEIMDDSGTFPVGNWLREFCNLMIQSSLNRRVKIDCNMRFGGLNKSDFVLMKKAGFRMLLFGLESGNQDTLDMLNKNINLIDVIKDCTEARTSGLYPHVTMMYGYPGEDNVKAQTSFELAKSLIDQGLVTSIQASIVTPYPGTQIFEDWDHLGLIKTKDWSKYDMTELVVDCPLSFEQISCWVNKTFGLMISKSFVWNRIKSVKDFSDMLYIGRGLSKVISRKNDFRI